MNSEVYCLNLANFCLAMRWNLRAAAKTNTDTTENDMNNPKKQSVCEKYESSIFDIQNVEFRMKFCVWRCVCVWKFVDYDIRNIPRLSRSLLWQAPIFYRCHDNSQLILQSIRSDDTYGDSFWAWQTHSIVKNRTETSILSIIIKFGSKNPQLNQQDELIYEHTQTHMRTKLKKWI